MELKAGKDYVGAGVGIMVRNEKGEILFMKANENTRNEPGKWRFPGGEIEFGETVFEAAKRETAEETGIEIEPVRLLKLYDQILKEEKQHWLNPLIEAKLVKGEPKITEPEKFSEIKWFSIENLPEPMISGCNALFKDIKEGKIKL